MHRGAGCAARGCWAAKPHQLKPMVCFTMFSSLRRLPACEWREMNGLLASLALQVAPPDGLCRDRPAYQPHNACAYNTGGHRARQHACVPP